MTNSKVKLISKIKFTTSPIIQDIQLFFAGRTFNQQNRFQDLQSPRPGPPPNLPPGCHSKLSNNYYYQHDARRLARTPIVISNKNLLASGQKEEKPVENVINCIVEICTVLNICISFLSKVLKTSLSKPDQPAKHINLDQPRWDQTTYAGRTKHFFNLTNPLNMLCSTKELDEARDVITRYRKGEDLSNFTEEQLWRFKTIYDSSHHIETGERQIMFGRMCAQVPMNMLITGCMLTFYKTTQQVVFWQWFNQSFNAVVNYTNRSGDSPLSVQQLGSSYAMACGGALGTALGLKALCKNVPPIFSRFVPFASVAAANMVNIPFVRKNELTEGIQLVDKDGNKVGQSQVAAKRAISQVVASRIGMAAPGMIIPPILMNRLEKKGVLKRMPWISAPLQVFLAGFFLTFMIPMCCAIWPQNSPIDLSELEPELQEKIKKLNLKETTFYYNKDTIHISAVESINRTESIDKDDRIQCPKHCVCVDPTTTQTTGNREHNHSFIEPNSFETNCTYIHSDLETILNSIPAKTTHLYLYRNVFTKDNLLKFPRLEKLKFLKLTLNSIKFIDENSFLNIQHLNTFDLRRLKKLTLSSISNLGSLPNLTNIQTLEHLTVDRCELKFLPLGLCDWLPNIKSLTFKSNRLTSLPYLTNCTELQLVDLSYNFITSLDTQYFFPISNKITYLFLKNNLIKELEENNLEILTSLQVLDLEYNRIIKIHPKAFVNLTNLIDLNLGKNKFPVLPTEGLQNIVELKTFGNINLKDFPAPIYFPKVQKLALSYAYHCCEFMRREENEIDKLNSFGNLIDELELSSKIYEKITWLQNDLISSSPPLNKSTFDTLHNHHHRSSSSTDHTKDQSKSDNMLIMKYHVDCIPKPSPFMPCEDLFDFWTLRCSVWLVFLLAVLGNATVIVVLLFGRTKLDVPRFLVCNLALADFLMGIYLCILALVDSATLTMFRTFAVTWQNSALCLLAGFLAVFSTELSVFILAIITLERNYAITNAMHLNKRLSLRKASIIMIFGYIFVFSLAVLPLFGVSSYQKFAVCLPFEIEDSWSRIYVLSLVIFNGFAFLILIGCYLRMYCAIRGSQVWFSNDSRIAKRMSLLVFTDFLCWAPIALCTSPTSPTDILLTVRIRSKNTTVTTCTVDNSFRIKQETRETIKEEMKSEELKEIKTKESSIVLRNSKSSDENL